MPIKIPNSLPAMEVLEQEGVSVLSYYACSNRGLRIAILNLMPNKEDTETQFCRLIGATPLNVELTLIRMSHHKSKNTAASHLEAFYLTFVEAKTKTYDGLIITGAPVEKMDFEKVNYWEELIEIFQWTQTNVHMTMAVCWGAQAMLHHFYKVPKHLLNAKAFGCMQYENLAPGSPYLRGFADAFYMPCSRWTECHAEDLPKNAGLCTLCSSSKGGLCLVEDPAHRALYMFNHLEYDTNSLKSEYDRDVKQGIDIALPENYFPNDDPSQPPKNTWRANGHLLYINWISEMFRTQSTTLVPADTVMPVDGL